MKGYMANNVKVKEIMAYCTITEMIERDLIDHSIGGKNLTNGFSIGKRGKVMFWMWDPTPNGYYKLYQQDPETFEVIGIRYVDANKTMVTVWKRSANQSLPTPTP